MSKAPVTPCPRPNCGGAIVRFDRDDPPRCSLCGRTPSREQMQRTAHHKHARREVS